MSPESLESSEKTLNEKLTHYRLNRKEWELITEQLGREPQGVEWAIYSALWSEHCSYKSSRIHLKKFYNKSKRVLQSFGENAGVIDLGEGERVAFKMESHNHPSYISPYQGAATGVGGILRDIFTMGARPIALANYLCFGEPSAQRMTSIVKGVVRGIGDYGNCVGVPNITGKTHFDSSYNENVLVNALAVGLYRPGQKIFLSQAQGIGNWVVYVGAKTGRDGVHGASMASQSFGEDSSGPDSSALDSSNKTTVQIGDPFYEKLLIESCLEVMEKNLVVAIQDMGAAGLTSSSFEMAASGGVGLKLYLDQVPLRDNSITPEEILLSESQERMLLVCEPDNFEKLQEIFTHWNLDAVKVGEIQKNKTIEIYWQNERLCALDPQKIVEQAPQYERDYQPWAVKNQAASYDDKDPLKTLNSVSRDWIYNQYDQRVGASTVRACSESVGVVRLPDSGRTLGLVLGCRPYIMNWDAKEGGKDAVAYPALQLSAKGFKPLAITDCLNFGNPENSQIMSEFVASIEGINEICKHLDTPVISGNVSFYNETQGRNIISTPATGMVGLGPKADFPLAFDCFQKPEEEIYLLSNQNFIINRNGGFDNDGSHDNGSHDDGSHIEGIGLVDGSGVSDLCQVAQGLAQSGHVSASKVVGKYGLKYGLLRMCQGRVGARLHLSESLFKRWHLEFYYEILWSVKKDKKKEFEDLAKKLMPSSVELQHLGFVTDDLELNINDRYLYDTKTAWNEYTGVWEKYFG